MDKLWFGRSSMKSHSGFGVDTSNDVLFLCSICSCPDIRSSIEHFHSVLIIIMFKEVKIQYTINLTLLRTSLFLFWMRWTFQFSEASRKRRERRAEQYLTLCHSRRIRVNVHCGLFVMDFSHHYDCYCYCDCQALHIRRLRFCFDLFSISLLVISNVWCSCWIEGVRHSHHHGGRLTGQEWNMEPFFSFGCRIYRRVSKSLHWCVKADSSSQSHCQW